MVDYAKIRLRGRKHRHYRQALRTHPQLRWTPPIYAVDHPPTGCTMVASWNEWTFYGDGTTVLEIRGSFHKYYHGNNLPDFTHAQFVEAVHSLCNAFQLFPGALHFLNLEVGVNITPPMPTRDLLPFVLFHRTQRPQAMRAPAIGIYIEHKGHFRYKIYDKAAHGLESFELLRIELHVDRMAILNRIGIHTAADLLDPASWGRLRAFLLDKFDELFIAGADIDPDAVTAAQGELLSKAKDGSYWKGLTANKRHRKRGKVERLWRTHSRPYLKDELRHRIAAKVDTLTAAEQEGGTFDATCARAQARTPANTGVVHHPLPVEVTPQAPDPGTDLTDVKQTTVNTLRLCQTCGRDITDQRAGSVYCSEARYSNAGKRCRNAGSNPRNNRLRSLERIEREPLLFDHRPYITNPRHLVRFP
jgi:hypothetical protein